MKTQSWADFKSICVTAKKLNLQYELLEGGYHVIGPDANGINWDIFLPNLLPDPNNPGQTITNPDVTDFVSNIQASCNGSINQIDSDGAQLSRIKVAPTGWSFNYRMVELELSTNGSLTNNDTNGNDVGDATMKLYDATGTLLTGAGVQTTCVKTVVDFEPPYNICVAGGCLRMSTSPAEDVYLNVVAVPDVPAMYGGSKVFIQNVNLSYINGTVGLDADGRAAKQLTYSATYHTNKFRFQFTHPAGYQFWCAILMEIYKQ